jgi:DNA modification methylase
VSVKILVGDCLVRLAELPDNSVDSVVCDPPYHLTNPGDRRSNNGEKAGSGDGVNAGQYGRLLRGFMGQTWDGGDVAFRPETWAEVLRVLKPGGYLVAFSGTRTYHRMAVAIEDAGFEVRDMIAWHYGSGFPKSHDVSKAIDRATYSEPLFETIRGHIRHWKDARGHSNKSLNAALGLETNGCGMARHWTSTEGGQHMIPSKDQWRNLKRVLDWPDCELDATYDAVKDGAARPVLGKKSSTLLAVAPGQSNDRSATVLEITAAATDAAKQWEGYGTALKPATEPICLARKPLSEKSVAANVLKWGTGALNIDGCRIGTESTIRTTNQRMTSAGKPGGAYGSGGYVLGDHRECGSEAGRWPANLVHDGSAEVVAGFPDAPGQLYTVKGTEPSSPFANIYGDMPNRAGSAEPRGDSGSAARFFYCAKADGSERGSKCEVCGLVAASEADACQCTDPETGKPNRLAHPTVKPHALMTWLVRLVTPEGGTVLDPFAGTGSTGIAAQAEQMGFIGCELSPDYAAIAEARLRKDAGLFAQVTVCPGKAAI